MTASTGISYPALIVAPNVKSGLTKETITTEDIAVMRKAILVTHKNLTQKNGESPTVIAIPVGWWLQLYDMLKKLQLHFNKHAPETWGNPFSPKFTMGYDSMGRHREPTPEGETNMVDDVTQPNGNVQQVSKVMALVQAKKGTAQDTESEPSIMELVERIATSKAGVNILADVKSMLEIEVVDEDGDLVEIDFPLAGNGSIVMQKEESILFVWPMFDEDTELDQIGVMYTDQPTLVYIFTANLATVYDYTVGEFAGELDDYIVEELAVELNRTTVAFEEFVGIMREAYGIEVSLAS